MIKTIRPGRLANLSDAAIADSLTRHLHCYVSYAAYEAHIYTVEDYSNSKVLWEAMGRLRNVGDATVCCDRRGPYVRLVFNEVARAVIDGKTSSLPTEEEVIQ